MALLEVRNVKKVYTAKLGAVKVQALSDVNFSVEEGEYVAIMGESGSGKTTLLNILASLDKATSGQVLLRGKDLSEIRHRDICAFRREHLGFVFQDFNLLDTLTLKDNIHLPHCPMPLPSAAPSGHRRSSCTWSHCSGFPYRSGGTHSRP